MTDPRALDILLHGRRIGTIVALEGDASVFSFAKTYLDDPDRPTLSLSYRDVHGDIIDRPRARRVRLEPYFSNLLPEGALRDYLARRTGVNAVREFPLLASLGHDLSGAVQAIAVDGAAPTGIEEAQAVAEPRFRFSLAGVQLKFSALKNKGKKGGLTIPVGGEGGGWIVKLPSTSYAGVPENEYSVMSLAARLGIDVPQIELINLDNVEGLPEGVDQLGETAFAIKRFDRSTEGAIHVEDFAQVFGRYPEAKYDTASYTNILTVLADTNDERSIDQFVRRLTFSVLVGNGDMHLKNWSLIYPDARRPILSPVYDLLSTVAYVPDEESALKIRRSKAWGEFDEAALVRMADKARVAATPVLKAARETIEAFDDVWNADKHALPMPDRIVAAIDRHRASLAV